MTTRPGLNHQPDVTSSYPNAGGAGFQPPLGRTSAARTWFRHFLVWLLAIAVTVLASLVAALLPIPHASAAETTRTDLPVPYPMDTTTVVIVAPDDAWGLRQVAADYDRRVDELDLVYGRGATCRPDLACVNVIVDRFGKRFDCGDGRLRWLFGCVYWNGPDYRDLRLNESYDLTRRHAKAIACHELGHALGLDHHDGHGCLAGTETTSPSRAEVRALERAYALLA